MNYVIEQIANAGRYGDDKLVHMSSDEVAGLKGLANAYGTKITKNPQTGLDEAFNLKSLLPMVAGLALGPAGVGLTALQAGIATGVGGALITGDPLQGAMMGLGGYGGAGLGGALSSAGSAGAQAGNTAVSTGTETITAATPTNLPNAFPGGVPPMNPATDTLAMGSGTTPGLANAFSPSEVASQAANYTQNVVPPASTSSGGFGAVGDGLQGVISDAPGAREAFMSPVEQGGIGGKSGLFKSGLAASAPMFEEALQPEEMNAYSDGEPIPFESYLDEYGLRRVRPKKFAEGGLTDASLTNKSGLGSLIQGSGDGMGDEVPALVSPGEYIITAQAVSALGNGNTDAGAKKLDGMMDRIYKSQSGEAKQMPRMSDSVMPT